MRKCHHHYTDLGSLQRIFYSEEKVREISIPHEKCLLTRAIHNEVAYVKINQSGRPLHKYFTDWNQ